jgi:hypothetical protein
MNPLTEMFFAPEEAEKLHVVEKINIDRLEAQERTIADKDAKIAELTARAERAERERDAAVADLKLGKVCMTCKHDEKCRKEVAATNQTQCIGKQRWEWRGLPQEGEKE